MKRFILVAGMVTVGFMGVVMAQSSVRAKDPAFYFKNNTDMLLDLVIFGPIGPTGIMKKSIEGIGPLKDIIDDSIPFAIQGIQINGCKTEQVLTECSEPKEELGFWRFEPKADTKKYYIKFYVDKKMGKYVLEPQTGGLKGLRNQTTGKIDGQKIRYSLSGNIKKIVQQ